MTRQFRFAETAEVHGRVSISGGRPAPTAAERRSAPPWRRTLVTFVAVSLVAAASPASAAVPTTADFAACNAEAQSARRAGTVIPTTKDFMHAEAARRSRAEMPPAIDPTGTRAPYSSDPQLIGMDGEGTLDATYQAAYRTCMRRKGF